MSQTHPPPTQASEQRPPKKRRRKWPWFFLGFIALIVFVVIVSTSGGGGSSTVNSGSGSTAAGLNQPARDGKFQFTVTSVSAAKSVGDIQNGVGATAQGEYVILHLTVTNIGTESQILDDSAQYVYDSQGRKYSADTSADIWLGNGSSNVWLQSINPGNTVTGEMAFDMPPTATPAKAELHDSVLSGGMTVALH